MADIRHYDDKFTGPDNWFDGSTVSWIGPADEGYCPNITITRNFLESEKTSGDYSKGVKDALSSQFGDSGYEVIKEYDLTVSEEIEAAARIHKFYVEKIGFKVKQI